MNLREGLNLFDQFNDLRLGFLETIAETHLRSHLGSSKPALSIITHLLPDRPALITILSRYFDIQRIFAIPYSTDASVAAWVSQRFRLLQPTLEELVQAACVQDDLLASRQEKVILLDIGGYGAPIVSHVAKVLGDRFLGVIEGTEAGFTQYSGVQSFGFPVVCMSLSPVKTAETALVGLACLFSVERILRSLGFTNEIKSAAVLGYGRIGKSVAEAFRAHGLAIYAFDTNPEQRIQALADGFFVPDRPITLATADLLLAATGRRSWNDDDAQFMRDGAFLVSCSSKDVEFDFSGIKARHPVEELTPWLHAVTIRGKRLHFVYEGLPVNFRDGANIGPLLSLVQGEVIAVCGDLLQKRFASGVQAPSRDTRNRVIAQWFTAYIDSHTGWYRKRSI